MVKRYLFIVACLLLFSCINSKGQDTLKSFNKKWGTELSFNPFNGNLTLDNSNTQLKFRRFYSKNKALRLSIAVNYKQDNNNSENPYGYSPINESLRRKSLFSAINIGIEKHFNGSRRLSPYIGWELGVGYKTSKQYDNKNSERTTINGGWATTQYYYNGGYYFQETEYSERGFWSLGANLIFGFDFYMTQGFYFGYEALFGFDYINYSNISYTPRKNSDGDVYPKLDDESWNLGPKLINGIRIGYLF